MPYIFRPATPEELAKYKISFVIPATASQAQLPTGEYIFYDYNNLVRLYPDYVTKSDSEKLAFLATNPAGVYIKVPLQYVFVPDDTPQDTTPVTPSLGEPVVALPEQPSTPTNPIDVTPPVVPNVNLASIITVDKQSIDREYIKDSMQSPQSDSILFKNISDTITVNLQITGASGVVYNPTIFSLAPFDSKTVSVSFDAALLNQLPEGISTIATTISLTSPSTVITPPVPQPQPPIQEPPITTQPAGPSVPITPPWEPVDTTPWIPETPIHTLPVIVDPPILQVPEDPTPPIEIPVPRQEPQPPDEGTTTPVTPVTPAPVIPFEGSGGGGDVTDIRPVDDDDFENRFTNYFNLE